MEVCGHVICVRILIVEYCHCRHGHSNSICSKLVVYEIHSSQCVNVNYVCNTLPVSRSLSHTQTHTKSFHLFLSYYLACKLV